MHLTDLEISLVRRVTTSMKQPSSQSVRGAKSNWYSVGKNILPRSLSHALCKVKNTFKSVNIDYSNAKLIKKNEGKRLTERKGKLKCFSVLLFTQHSLVYVLYFLINDGHCMQTA